MGAEVLKNVGGLLLTQERDTEPEAATNHREKSSGRNCLLANV